MPIFKNADGKSQTNLTDCNINCLKEKTDLLQSTLNGMMPFF